MRRLRVRWDAHAWDASDGARKCALREHRRAVLRSAGIRAARSENCLPDAPRLKRARRDAADKSDGCRAAARKAPDAVGSDVELDRDAG
jgi:hypothetical protein